MSADDEFGELALVAGDFNIPNLSGDLPQAFKELIVIS